MSERDLEKLLKELVLAIERQTIVMLGIQGVPQAKIRAALGADINRISRILKHLKGHTK